MARESRFSTNRHSIFREPCTAESVGKNGGVITGDITFSNGVADFNGLVNSRIEYPTVSVGNEFTLHVKYTVSRKNASLHALVIQGDTFSTSATNSSFGLLQFQSDGRVGGYAWTTNGTIFARTSVYTSEIFADGDKVNVYVTFKDKALTVVTNGTKYISSTTYTSLVKSTYTLLIGNPSIGSYYTDEHIELVEILDYAMSDEEIALDSRNALYKGAVR